MEMLCCPASVPACRITGIFTERSFVTPFCWRHDLSAVKLNDIPESGQKKADATLMQEDNHESCIEFMIPFLQTKHATTAHDQDELET